MNPRPMFQHHITNQLERLVVSKEAEDSLYLRSIFKLDSRFMKYQYALVTLKQSVYNNVYLRYRRYVMVSTLLTLTAGEQRVLDVGCGYGDLSLELANRGKVIVLLDLDPSLLQVAMYRFRRFGLKGEPVCADANWLPFRNGCFDASFSSNVVEHVAFPIKMVQEKLRVSKSKAIVISMNASSALSSSIIGLIYFRLLKRGEREKVPDTGGYDRIYYLNPQIIPFNCKMAIVLARMIESVPYLRRVLAGNVAKVYEKRLCNGNENTISGG